MTTNHAACLLVCLSMAVACGPTTPTAPPDALADVREDAYAFLHVDVRRARHGDAFSGLAEASPALAQALSPHCGDAAHLDRITLSRTPTGGRVHLVGDVPDGCAEGLLEALVHVDRSSAQVTRRGRSVRVDVGTPAPTSGLVPRARAHLATDAVVVGAVALDQVPDQAALRARLELPERLHARFVDGAVVVGVLGAAPEALAITLDLADDERVAIAEQTLLRRVDAYRAIAAGLVDEALRDPETPSVAVLPGTSQAPRSRGTDADVAELAAAVLALAPTRTGPSVSLALRVDGARAAPTRALVDALSVAAVREAHTAAAIVAMERLADALDAHVAAASPGARRLPRPLPPIPRTPHGYDVVRPATSDYVAGWLDLGVRLAHGSPFSLGADVGTDDYTVFARADFDRDGDPSELRIEATVVDGRVVRRPLGHGNPGE